MFGDPHVDYTFVNITSVGTFSIIAKDPDEIRFGIKPKYRTYTDRNNMEKKILEYSTNSLKGTLLKAKIRTTDFGDQISINLETIRNKETYHFNISASVSSIYGRSLLERLPYLNKGDEIMIKVWGKFISNEGKTVFPSLKIINTKTGEQIYSYFWDNENKQPLHGYPTLEKNASDTKKKIYFAMASDVVCEYFVKNVQDRFISENEQEHYESQEGDNDNDNPFSEPLDEGDDLPF